MCDVRCKYAKFGEWFLRRKIWLEWNEILRENLTRVRNVRYVRFFFDWIDFAGEKLRSLESDLGISKSSAYVAKDKFIDAVLQCPDLDIQFPTTTDELSSIAKGFEAKATASIFQGCVEYLPTRVEDREDVDDFVESSVLGASRNRDIIVDYIRHEKFTRPTYNLARNAGNIDGNDSNLLFYTVI